jgi:uncharacterized protein (TIGR02453 family)
MLFGPATFDFLGDLAAHNQREWFEANRERYEACVREPALAFIAAMAPELARFAPHFRADPRKAGGSLMRVFRDTRFSRDKTPYKTNIGIQFRHELGRDVHAPGFYVHIASDECFLGVGCWRPETTALAKIREHIAEDPARWFRVRDDRRFRAGWQLSGERLSRPPRGYPADHAAIEDLKYKDYVAMAPLAPDEITGPDLVAVVSRRFAAAKPLMAFLCWALDVPY